MTGPAGGVSVDAAVSARDLRVKLDVTPGDVIGLVGPNGAGKSSLVRLISGQLRADEGTVTIGGRVVSGPGVHLPVHRRRVALLEQRPLLFEHLDVVENVAFGPRALGAGRADALSRALSELDAVGCLDLAKRRVWEISGGQAQRVALARALAADPTAVLLDEPMAALDVTVAPAVRALLRDRIRGEHRTALLVTHDVIDALSLADTLVVMEGGRIVVRGAVTDLLTRPRNAFLADLVGVNLLVGAATSPDTVVTPTGDHVTGVCESPLAVSATALASFPPAAVAVHLEVPTGSPRNHLRATVTGLEPRGSLVRLSTVLPDGTALAADITLASVADAGLVPGTAVWLAVKAAQVSLYPR